MPLLTPNGLDADDLPAIEDDDRLPSQGRFTVSAARYERERATWTSQLRTRGGVHIEPNEDVEALAPLLSDAELVALRFTKMGDGRAFSQARLLRKRLGYDGRLIARGPVIADQFAFLRRCGFDGVEVGDDVQPESWLRALRRHRHSYQPD